jgi:hypothetical protein
MKPTYVYAATCVKVIDGDTYDLLVDLGFRAFEKVRVRLRGYNGKAPTLTMQSYKDQHSFERWVCDVWMPDGTPLGDALGLPKV